MRLVWRSGAAAGARLEAPAQERTRTSPRVYAVMYRSAAAVCTGCPLVRTCGRAAWHVVDEETLEAAEAAVGGAR